MPSISTADQFLGSLIGAYIGYHHHAEQCNQFPSTDCSQLSQTWQEYLSSLMPLGPNLKAPNLAAALLWLLYYYDDSQTRHQWLSQTSFSTHMPATHRVLDTSAALYLLGDSLEWLMQSSPFIRRPHSLLSQHLQRQCCKYPDHITQQVIPIIKQLDQWSHPRSIESPIKTEQPLLATINVAIQQTLTYRENLALALISNPINPQTAMTTGYLLGAWAGISSVPSQWMMALQPHSRQSLSQMAQYLYLNWSGIMNGTGAFEVFPLDL